MDGWLDWILTHPLDSAVITLVALLGGNKFWPQIKMLVGRGASVVEDFRDDEGDTAGDPRLRLSIALCQLTDHVHDLGDKAGIAACTTLAPLVMLQEADEPLDPEPA
jgi:hypothetical protein